MDKFLALLEDCEDLEAREDIYILSNILRAFSKIIFLESGHSNVLLTH